MKQIDFMEEVISELNEVKNPTRILSPEEKQKKTKTDLHKVAVQGRHALEFESSKVFKEFIEPAMIKKVKDSIKILIVDGLSLKEIELKVLIAEMQEALGPYTMIRNAKHEALAANRELATYEARDTKVAQRTGEILAKQRRAQAAILRKTRIADKLKKNRKK